MGKQLGRIKLFGQHAYLIGWLRNTLTLPSVVKPYIKVHKTYKINNKYVCFYYGRKAYIKKVYKANPPYNFFMRGVRLSIAELIVHIGKVRRDFIIFSHL